MNIFKKYLFRQLLSFINEQYQAAETTPTTLDDALWRQAYVTIRALALHLDCIDDGGADDPGPQPEGGGDGGP